MGYKSNEIIEYKYVLLFYCILLLSYKYTFLIMFN